MLKMAAIFKSNMAAMGTEEKSGNNLIWVPGSLLHHLRPKTQIVHEPHTKNISNHANSIFNDNLYTVYSPAELPR